MRPAILILSVSFVLVAACAGQAPATAPQATTGQASQPAAPAPSVPAAEPGGSGMSVAHIEVGGGDLAGTYDATGEKSDCNVSGDGSGATYLDVAKTEGLTGLIFTSGEGGGNPAEFYFQALFGAIGASQPILEISTLDPATARGSGTAQLEDKGGTIKWTIDGQSADGVTVKATIECGPVDRR